jgi:hypothetical protein
VHNAGSFEVVCFNVEALVRHDALVEEHLQGGDLGQGIGKSPYRFIFRDGKRDALQRRVAAILHVICQVNNTKRAPSQLLACARLDGQVGDLGVPAAGS